VSGDFFFVIGIILVVAALLLAVLGITRTDRFPPNRAVMVGLLALFAAGVVTTMAFAIVKSNDEQDARNEKLAAEEPQPGGTPATGETLDVTSPADGSLTYQPNGLQAQPGNVTVTYKNPSQVPHSIAVATSNGNVLGEVQPFTNSSESVHLANLAPGKYVFYCTVPGHREAGMQGDLTVLAGGGKSGR
jgi:plastocyanin